MTEPTNRPEQSSGILILGMHRSGTTLVARLLEAGGAHLGDRLLGGSPGNEEGHWENMFVLETNESLLHALGRSWSDVRELSSDWQTTESAAKSGAAIRSYGLAVLQTRTLWALKDPRLCLLAPVWIDALTTPTTQLSAVLPIRHPWEVADSLAARNGLAHGLGLLLWLRHALAAEAASRSLPRLILRYADILENPMEMLERAGALPGGEHLARGPEIVERVRSIARPDLRHHTAEGSETRTLPSLVQRAWEALDCMPPGEDQTGALDQIATEFAVAAEVFGPVAEEMTRIRDDQASYELTLHVRPRLDELAASLSRLESISRDHAETLIPTVEYVKSVLNAVNETISNQADANKTLIPTVEYVKSVLNAVNETISDQADSNKLRLAQLETELETAREEVHLLRGSRSWRITRPLRAIGRLVRRLAWWRN